VELTYASTDYNHTPNTSKNSLIINNNMNINKDRINLKNNGSNNLNFSLNNTISRFLSTNAVIQDRINNR
jgi:hypothetical protein